jgi:hypothetical protein
MDWCWHNLLLISPVLQNNNKLAHVFTVPTLMYTLYCKLLFTPCDLLPVMLPTYITAQNKGLPLIKKIATSVPIPTNSQIHIQI